MWIQFLKNRIMQTSLVGFFLSGSQMLQILYIVSEEETKAESEPNTNANLTFAC